MYPAPYRDWTEDTAAQIVFMANRKGQIQRGIEMLARLGVGSALCAGHREQAVLVTVGERYCGLCLEEVSR